MSFLIIENLLMFVLMSQLNKVIHMSIIAFIGMLLYYYLSNGSLINSLLVYVKDKVERNESNRRIDKTKSATSPTKPQVSHNPWARISQESLNCLEIQWL